MIAIRLMGGLGNQLFQFTAVRVLRSLGRPARCELSWFATAGRTGETPRPFELERLLHGDERFCLPTALARVAYSSRNPWSLRERVPDDDLLRRLPARRAWAQGYYQRAEYPLRVGAELSARLLPLLECGAAAERAREIGVHIRRGDYVTQAGTRARHGATDGAYFAAAVAHVRGLVGDLPVRIFTDSPELLAAALLDRLPGERVLSDTPGSWDALRELAACAGIVMSNSTLSWWAAFAASVLRGRPIPVVMPAPWFATPSTADDALYVAGWHRMPRRLEAP